jgi:hypothetical protein
MHTDTADTPVRTAPYLRRWPAAEQTRGFVSAAANATPERASARCMYGARSLAAVGLLLCCATTPTAAKRKTKAQAQPAVGGGWHDAPRADDEAQACACTRTPLSEVSSLPTDAPLIVTGVTDEWPATSRWAKRELTRGRKGDLVVTAAGPSEIAGGVAHDLGVRLPLRDFVERMEHESLFVFDSNASLLHGHRGGFNRYPPGGAYNTTTGGTGALARDFVTPDIFKAFLQAEDVGWNMLSLGGADEGLGFHTQ